MKPIKSIYGDECKEIKWTKKFKAGYVLQNEFITMEVTRKEDGVWMTVAYNHNGDYIGTNREAFLLCVKRGILPEPISSKGEICSIGYSKKNKKYYGWSHRVIYGFKIGDKVKKGDCTNSSGLMDEYLENHPEEDKSLSVGFKAKNLEDCRSMAIAFARCVG